MAKHWRDFFLLSVVILLTPDNDLALGGAGPTRSKACWFCWLAWDKTKNAISYMSREEMSANCQNYLSLPELCSAC